MSLRILNSFEAKTWIFLVCLTIFRVTYGVGLGATPDEADYVVWSQQLDWSYFCHPPLLMYFLALFKRVIIHDILALRLTLAALSALASIYIFFFARDLFDDGRLAYWSVVCANLTLLFMAGSLLATPDTPMILFLSGACYYFYHAVTTARARFWLLAGVFTGLALVSKLVAVLLYGSFLLFFLLTRKHRRWLTQPQPYLAFGVSLLIFAPVVIWNAGHGWTTFGFQLQHGFGSRKPFPRWDRFFEYLGSQVGLIGPVLFGLFVAALLIVAMSWQRRSVAEKLLWCLASVPFLFFLAASLQKKVEANWACFAYVPGIVLITHCYDRAWRYHAWGRRLWRLNWGYTLLVLILLLVHIYVPLLPIAHDRTDDFYGWDQLGQAAKQLAATYPNFQLAANRYQLASELIFYAERPTICLNINSRPNQYDFWQDRAMFQGQNYLFFDHRRTPQPSVVGAFQRFEHIAAIPLTRGTQVIRTIQVYKALRYQRPE